MSKNKLIVGIVALTVGFIVLAMLLSQREPEYCSRKLTEWLADLDPSTPVRGSLRSNAVPRSGFSSRDWRKTENSAMDAVRHIGVDGVPILISMIDYHEPAWRRPLYKLMSRQTLVQIEAPVAEENVKWRGLRGIRILGTNATEAALHLVPIFTNRSAWLRGAAALAAGDIVATNGVVVHELVRALDDPVHDVRNCAAIGLAKIGPAAQEALPGLIQHFDDANIDTRGLVVSAFLSISNDTASAVPHLISHLSDSLSDGRANAVLTLGYLGQRAQSALPKLTNLLSDPDRVVRFAATTAVARITGNSNRGPASKDISFRFRQVSIEQVLTVYAELRQAPLEFAPDVRRSAEVTIDPRGPLSRESAMELIEQELREQAKVEVVSGTTGAIRVIRLREVKRR